MKCIHCQFELDENAVFCENCGSPVVVPEVPEETPTQQEPTTVEAPAVDAVPVTETAPAAESPTATEKKDIHQLLSLIVGTALIVIGMIRLFTSGATVSSASFGGDFYTYAYQGIVACAEMLGKVNATVAWLIVAIGAYIDLGALKGKLSK